MWCMDFAVFIKRLEGVLCQHLVKRVPEVCTCSIHHPQHTTGIMTTKMMSGLSGVDSCTEAAASVLALTIIFYTQGRLQAEESGHVQGVASSQRGSRKTGTWTEALWERNEESGQARQVSKYTGWLLTNRKSQKLHWVENLVLKFLYTFAWFFTVPVHEIWFLYWWYLHNSLWGILHGITWLLHIIRPFDLKMVSTCILFLGIHSARKLQTLFMVP